MAVLPMDARVQMRNRVATLAEPVVLTKAQSDAVSQRIEDWFEGCVPELSGLLNLTTAPVILSPEQKRAFLAAYLRLRSTR